jgi:hypothetical protein
MDVVIHHVELSLVGGDQPVYVVTIEDPNFVDNTGSGAAGAFVQVMPTEVFETRAAEYDIDPAAEGAWEMLFDLVFGDQHVGQGAAEQLNDPDWLLNAPTSKHARAAQLKKIRKVLGKGKTRGVPGTSVHRAVLNDATGVMNSETEDPLEFIKRTAPMSPDHIRVKQEFTRRRRNLRRVRRAGRNPTELTDVDAQDVDAQVVKDMQRLPVRESAEALAQRLLGDVPVEDREDRVPPREGTASKYL